MEPHDILRIQADLEAMVGARCGKLSGLGQELLEELRGFAKDLLQFGAAHPETQPFALDVVTYVLTAGVEITAGITRLAEHVQRRAEADRGPERPA